MTVSGKKRRKGDGSFGALRRLAFLGSLWLLCQPVVGAGDSKRIPRFQMEAIRDGAPLVSSTFPESLLVLDFFAPWCLSCLDVARRVDQEVKPHYREQAGEVPVKIVGVNIDQSRPRSVERFLERSGLGNAFNDPDGELFDRLSGQGVPFLVVLSPEDGSGFREVVYQQMGMDDTASLKRAIDHARERIAQASVSSGVEPSFSGAGTPRGPAPVSFRLDNALEYKASEDISLWVNDLQWEIQSGSLRFTNLLSLGRIGVDYEPSAKTIFGAGENLEENNWAYSLTGEWSNAQQAFSFGGGLGEGLQDYRSVWLAEFYRQGFESDPVYSEPDPRSVFVTGEWSRLFYYDQVQLSVDGSYRKDTVAPPYERVIPANPGEAIFTRVGREQLRTASLGFGVDWIATERTRVESRLSMDETTGRDLRWSGELTLKQVFADSWVATLRATHVSEGDAFEAWSFEGGLDYDFEETWFLGLSFRYYQDEGLVRDPTIISADAPALETFRGGVRLARVSGPVSLSLSLFHYRTLYEALGTNSFEYENLYRDRDWVQARFACSLAF